MYEIEMRARFDEAKYNELKKFLDTNAENLGEDNKDCHYLIFPDKLLKLVLNTSKHTAKVSLKMNRIGQGAAFEEIEFYFPPEEFETALKLFQKLDLPVRIMSGPQRRVNYKYQDCEIALKWSDVWGYHMEIEQMIEDQSAQVSSEMHIRKVAEDLGVCLMSEDELKEFVCQVEKNI